MADTAFAAFLFDSSAPAADRVTDINECHRRRSVALAAGERTALTSADVVFVEAGVDAALVALTPRHALIEAVPGEGSPIPVRERAVARAQRLAEDGWRVVWLTATAAGDQVIDLVESEAAFALARPPHMFATALNGLAG
jgi:hypothetical protein